MLPGISGAIKNVVKNAENVAKQAKSAVDSSNDSVESRLKTQPTTTPAPPTQNLGTADTTNGTTEDKLLKIKSPLDIAIGLKSGQLDNLASPTGPVNPTILANAGSPGSIVPFQAAQAQINPTDTSPEAIVDRVTAEPDLEKRPQILADELDGLEPSEQAAVIEEVGNQNPEAFDQLGSGQDAWLNPANLENLVRQGEAIGEVKLTDDGAEVLGNAIAAGWNQGVIPERPSSDGLGPGVSLIDVPTLHQGEQTDFVSFFDRSRSDEVTEFRTSYANHLHETYIKPGSILEGAAAGDFTDLTANAAARLVAGPGVSHQVTLDFYQETFGPNGSAEFSQFLEHAVDGAGDSRSDDFDPLIGFTEAARVPRSSPHDLVHFDSSTIPAREDLAIGLAEAVGRSGTDTGVFGLEINGVLSNDDDQRTQQLEAITNLFGEHSVAILDHLSTDQSLSTKADGTINSTHPALTNFIRFTVGNTDLSNREVARDAVVDYFDRQIDIVERSADQTNSTAQNRAINVVAAASHASQGVVSDNNEIIAAREKAASFVLDTALNVIQVDRARKALSDAVGGALGGRLSGRLTQKVVDELLKSGSGRLSSGLRSEVIDALISEGGIGGNLATTQEILNLTVNPLQELGFHEDTGPGGDRGLLSQRQEEFYDDIVKGVEDKSNVGPT